MTPEQTTNIATVMALLVFIALVAPVAFMLRRARENREACSAALALKVAGDDMLEGGARHPEAWRNPPRKTRHDGRPV